jgi:predicted nucleotidyltransferase
MTQSTRLNQLQIETIKNIIYNHFGESEIYLFGSQINLKKRGGDIDLFIICNKKIDLETKLKAKIELQNKLLTPVDIIISKDKNRMIEKEALKGVKLKKF